MKRNIKTNTVERQQGVNRGEKRGGMKVNENRVKERQEEEGGHGEKKNFTVSVSFHLSINCFLLLSSCQNPD